MSVHATRFPKILNLRRAMVRQLPNSWLKLLKIAHLTSIALWMGGAAALLPILADVDFGNQADALGSYLSMRSVAWNVIGWGGIGTVSTGIALAAFSSWGFFRYRWVTVKLVVAPVLVLFGMFFIEHRILLNVAALEDGGSSGLLTTHRQVEIGLVFLLLAFASVIGLSVVKPWTRSLREAAPRAIQGRARHDSGLLAGREATIEE